MPNIIRLCYRKIIDANAQKQWDKNVWEDTYKEFVMQSQIYNGDKRYRLYSDLTAHASGADKLPFLVSTALVGYLKQLKGVIPDITNVLGKLCLPFKNYKFDIIESDVTNQSVHKIAVDFISEPVEWHDTVNGLLLISAHENYDVNDGARLTDMIMLQPFLSIFSVKKRNNMMPQSKAKLYPADERGLTQSDGFQSRYSFNFQNYQHRYKTAFGNLIHLNDDVFAAQQSLQFVAGADMYLVLIPMIGAVTYHDSNGNESHLVAGYVQMFTIAKDTVFALLNLYHDETVNFLQLWIQSDASFVTENTLPVQVCLDENSNQLNNIICHPQFSVSIGKFSGREEGSYKIKDSNNGIFTFVIDGQMEVQYRLLQPRDGLGLWDQHEIEWEALSASAILLVAEVNM